MLKKFSLTIISCASFISIAACGGQPDTLPTQGPFRLNAYGDLLGGYAFQNWNTLIGTQATIWASPGLMSSNEHGGYIGGIDFGLHLFKYFGVELGGFYMPKIEGDVVDQDINIGGAGCNNNGNSPCQSGHQWNWMGYAAGKFMIPISYFDGFSVFTKVGGAWRAMTNRKQKVLEYGGFFDNWEIIFGAGLEYILDQPKLRFGLQWLYLPRVSYPSTLDGPAPSQDKHAAEQVARMQPFANMITASVGYQLSL